MTIKMRRDTQIRYHGVTLVRRMVVGPRGGKNYLYQHAQASREWGYWYETASQAADESNASDRVVTL